MHETDAPPPRIIALKCRSELASYDQSVHRIQVESEDEANWYARPITNPACGLLQWPKFAWKEVKDNRKEGENAASNARTARVPSSTLRPGRQQDSDRPCVMLSTT
jgi:hypothetical protein